MTFLTQLLRPHGRVGTGQVPPGDFRKNAKRDPLSGGSLLEFGCGGRI